MTTEELIAARRAEPWREAPVSYTHLDVYKRQILIIGQLYFSSER